ncbi:peptide-methionine (S)-S-oxide reductase MsrA [Alteribacillus sp. HJP-4]|uniref:peptide-methionine (S)-S-oxide reductase MsrA n=1 Tax=Alteribacillus sp. HJP-4 TaxID=2775394 RepID=UPI0035CCD130
MNHDIHRAVFAGGCFWCMVGPFEQKDGVKSITAGYTGGHSDNPTYEEVCSNTTGHVEAVQIEYNPAEVTFNELLKIFWRQIDPTDPGGQFNDRGESYTTAVFYYDKEQEEAARASKKELEQQGKFTKPIVTDIRPATPFYPAEEYHQNYHKKNQFHYSMYKKGSGRDGFIKQNWGDQT